MFFLGYFVFSHDTVQDAVAKIRIPALISALALGIAYVFYYFGTNYSSPECLQSVFTNVYLWAAILAVMGCGKAWWNKENKVSKYLADSSFGLYIVHYPIVLAACLLLHNFFDLPLVFNYIIALIVEVVLSVAVYEVLRRIPVIRYFVLGIKKDDKASGIRRSCVVKTVSGEDDSPNQPA